MESAFLRRLLQHPLGVAKRNVITQELKASNVYMPSKFLTKITDPRRFLLLTVSSPWLCAVKRSGAMMIHRGVVERKNLEALKDAGWPEEVLEETLEENSAIPYLVKGAISVILQTFPNKDGALMALMHLFEQAEINVLRSVVRIGYAFVEKAVSKYRGDLGRLTEDVEAFETGYKCDRFRWWDGFQDGNEGNEGNGGNEVKEVTDMRMMESPMMPPIQHPIQPRIQHPNPHPNQPPIQPQAGSALSNLDLDPFAPFYFADFPELHMQVQKQLEDCLKNVAERQFYLHEWATRSQELYNSYGGRVSLALIQKALGEAGLDTTVCKERLRPLITRLPEVEEHFPQDLPSLSLYTRGHKSDMTELMKVYCQLGGHLANIERYFQH